MTINKQLTTVLIAFSTFLFSCGSNINQKMSSIIELGNEAIAEVDDYRKDLIKREKELFEFQESNNGSVFNLPYFQFFNMEVMIKNAEKSANNIKGEEPKLSANILEFTAIIISIEKNSKELESYIDSEDFKDDKAKKGLEMADIIFKDIEKFYELYSSNSKAIDVILDANKEVDNSIGGQAAANLEEDLDLAIKLFEKAEKITDLKEIVTLEEDYKALHESAKKHEEEDTGLELLKSSYTGFYEYYFNDFLSILKKLIRNAKANEVSNEDFQDALDDLLDKYNDSVESYNSFNEAKGSGVI